MSPLEEQLLKNLETFQSFARARINDPHLAADVVQDSLLKALKSSKKPKEGENVLAWFYRILRHAIVDLYRKNDVRFRAKEQLEQEQSILLTPEEKQVACSCLNNLLSTLSPDYAELIQRLI